MVIESSAGLACLQRSDESLTSGGRDGLLSSKAPGSRTPRAGGHGSALECGLDRATGEFAFRIAIGRSNWSTFARVAAQAVDGEVDPDP